MRILYTPTFVRQYDCLPASLQEDIRERIAMFRANPRNPSLRTHKLRGALREQWSFRVNYRYRILYMYDDKDTVALVAVGDHSVYG